MASQPITVNRKGQVTIPKRIREAMNLKPGSRVVFDANQQGEVVLRPEEPQSPVQPDRFERALGAATVKWQGSTDEYMELIRGYADDPR